MTQKRTLGRALLLWGILLVFLGWAAIKISMVHGAESYDEWRGQLMAEFAAPLDIRPGEAAPLYLLGALCIWVPGISSALSQLGKWRPEGEHGTADWGSAKKLRKKWEQPGAELTEDGRVLSDPNIILSENMRLGLGAGHAKNRNILVVGGSGTRKSTGLVMPNLMQCSSSYIITDPSGELYRSIGGLLEKRGYVVRCLNLVDMTRSHGMNPFRYLETPEDVARLATNFIANTDDKQKTGGGDPFWTDSMKLLLVALISFVWLELPLEEQNFGTLTDLLMMSRLDSDDMNASSVLDALFEDVGKSRPDALCYQNYLLYKTAPPKTRASIIITLTSRLASFTLPAVREIVRCDELELDLCGDRKQAVFMIIPQADRTYNFLVGMVYTSLFSSLYRKGEAVVRDDGKNFLPVPVQVLMDEFANVAQPDSFEQILATCRKYNISVSIMLQNMTQLKKLYEREWESIAGNCDTLIYLGGNEKFTWKYISEALDRETIHLRTTGRSGSSSSYSQQLTGRSLMTPGEVREIPDSKCIVMVRGEHAVLDGKYNIFRHPNFKETAMGGAAAFSQSFTRETAEERSIYEEMMMHYVPPDAAEQRKQA